MAYEQSMSQAPQNGPQSHLQPARASIKRKSRQDAIVQSAAIAQRMLNVPKTKIAKDLGIARGTLDTILDSAQIEQTILAGRSRAISLIPRSLDVCEYRLGKNDGNVALSLLRGTQVLQNQQVVANTTNNFAFMLAQLKQQSSDQPSSTSEQAAIVVRPEEPKK